MLKHIDINFLWRLLFIELVLVGLWACVDEPNFVPSHIPEGSFVKLETTSGAPMLAVGKKAVYSLKGSNGWRSVYRAPKSTYGKFHVELSPDAQHFGVYLGSKLFIHDVNGTQHGQLDTPPLGYRHKLIGRGRVLSPVVEQTGVHDGRVVALEVRNIDDALLARIAVSNVRFTRTSADYIVVATASTINRYLLDGQLVWTFALAAHDIAVADEADRMLVVDAHDTRRVLHLANGKQISSTEFRAPIWNVALSYRGQYAAVTTRSRLHLFHHARLINTIELPIAYAISLAVQKDGRTLVGAQRSDHTGVVLCYGSRGKLLSSETLNIDDNAFRPKVRWLDNGTYLAYTSRVLRWGRCDEAGP